MANKRLLYLQLSHNWLSDASAVVLARALLASGATPLEALVLDLNCIGTAGLEALLPLGGSQGRVRSWGFRHNELSNDACRAIAEARPRPMPAAWDLRTNGIGEEGCALLAPALEGMLVARLGCNKLRDAGVSSLAPGLGERLEILDLRQACFGEAGAMELAWALVNATSLEQLLLSGNEIGPEGASALSESWRWLLFLYHVDLSSNPLGNGGVAALAKELPLWKQSPLRLSLIGVSCGTEGAAKLKAALEANPRHEWRWSMDLLNNDPGIARHATAINQLLETKAELR